MKEIILKPDEIEKKIERISYQILESNLDFNKIFIAGIAKNGFHVAEKIVENLKIICDKEIILCKVIVDKKNPQISAKLALPLTHFANFSSERQGLMLNILKKLNENNLSSDLSEVVKKSLESSDN